MNITVYSTHRFDNIYLQKSLSKHSLKLLEVRLTFDTAVLAKGSEVVCIFVNDNASAPVLEKLKEVGVKYVALRSAGFNNVDLAAAKKLGLKIARVPKYSPAAVAEYTIALIMALNRKLIKAHNRIREMNFSLDGLVGFDLNGKTVGVIGAGNIGEIVIRILHGFGCRILVCDPIEKKDLKDKYSVTYTDCLTLCKNSDIITLHSPLTNQNKYLINKEHIDAMKHGVMLVNTSRGSLINTKEVIDALKTEKIGFLGMDVYEEEEGLFFEDHSEEIIQDDRIARLMSFPNVLITSHQAFLTEEALTNIYETTLYNIECWELDRTCENEL